MSAGHGPDCAPFTATDGRCLTCGERTFQLPDVSVALSIRVRNPDALDLFQQVGDDGELNYALSIGSGKAFLHFDPEAAKGLWRLFNAHLCMDEIEDEDRLEKQAASDMHDAALGLL